MWEIKDKVMEFTYLIDKIKDAEFEEHPFKHIYIENFFEHSDFKSITGAPEISLGECKTDEDLFARLFENDYKVISFPGCTTDYKEYIRKHSHGEPLTSHTACESSGIALRLSPKDEMLVALDRFLASDSFNEAIAEKFGIEYASCNVDGGIQKYLDGYEISPHPDIRRKAATFMVNINPHQDSEKHDHHTHYLKLNSDYQYVREFWESTPKAERQWVPWEWCTTEFLQTKNNSIVLFSPADDTMHGVKANYNHLVTQRTQLYGNLWYKSDNTSFAPTWEELRARDFSAPPTSRNPLSEPLRSVKGIAKKLIKPLIPKDPNIGDREH
ncbi:MAG: hypothetical protein AAGA68_03595 [Pseudomonadota bacterium]